MLRCGCGLGHVLTFMWTCTWSRCDAVGVGWGMYFLLMLTCTWRRCYAVGVGRGSTSRSCERAHEVDATLRVWVGAFMWTCTWSRCYAVGVGRGMYFLLMWVCTWSRCYAVRVGCRSSLQNPDPKRCLEELEVLLWTKDGWKIAETIELGAVKSAQKWRFRVGEIALFILLPVNKALTAFTRK